MKLVISEPKTGKAFNKKTDAPVFINRRIGEEVDLGSVGLAGFKAKITGGSDKQGFPMKPTVAGQARKKALLKKGIGFRPHRKGLIKRKSVRGNTISTETAQLNLVVTHYGEKPLSELLSSGTEKKADEKETAKERLVRESLESVGKTELAEDAKKIKGKVRG